MTTPARTSPHNKEAEDHLISCCLIDGAETIGKAMASGVKPTSFYQNPNRVIFETMLEMLASGKPIDGNTVYGELVVCKRLDDSVRPHFLGLIGKAPTTAQATYFSQQVASLSILREAISIATSLVETCYAYSGGDVFDTLSNPIGKLLALSSHDGKAEPNWNEIVDEALKAAEQMIQDQGKAPDSEIPFPWLEMNEKFGPMKPGQLIIVAGRTSTGKSSLVRPMACNAAQCGKKVYFDTLEVNPVQVVLQLASTLSKVGIRALGRSHPRDQDDFKIALKGLKKAGITMSRKDRSLAQVVARAKAMASQGKLDMIVIDHGGLLSDVYSTGKDEKIPSIGRMTKTLKHLAGELNCVVVLLWQLNRQSVSSGNREPVLSDLRDCGSLEEDADKVILIHRPSEDPITGQSQSDSDHVEERPRFFQNVIQAKGRDDGTSLMSFYFDRATASYIPATAERTS